MSINEIKSLLVKYLDGTIGAAEISELAKKIEYCTNEEIEDILSTIHTSDDPVLDSTTDHDMDIRLEKVYHALVTREIRDQSSRFKISASKLRIIWRVSAAACLLIVGAFIYVGLQKEDPVVEEVVMMDVNPAQPLAIIVLENGESIKVDSSAVGLIYSKDGLEVYQNEKGEIFYQDTINTDKTSPNYLTVTTPKGGFTKLKLSDGTVVELNAASSIRYPVNFSGDTREVFVEGEAFLNVFSDKKKPFLVHSQKQTIEVLGTSFNLLSNKDRAKTTLIEGKVKIMVNDKAYFLNPGQQASVSDKVEIKDVKPKETVAWKNEQFIFDNSTFYEILKEIENWYDVTIIFPHQHITNIQMSGTVSRNVKLSELLKVIEMNSDYTFEIKGRRVFVKQD